MTTKKILKFLVEKAPTQIESLLSLYHEITQNDTQNLTFIAMML